MSLSWAPSQRNNKYIQQQQPGPFDQAPQQEIDTRPYNTSKRTLTPYVTGTSVIGVKFDGGVMIAADTLGSYGNMARYKAVPRIIQVGGSSVMACSGDLSDWQQTTKTLDELILEDDLWNDNSHYSPKAIHTYLSKVMYNRRNKFDPLWNTILFAGYSNDTPYLGYIDSQGTCFQDETMATGYGAYIARPLLRNGYKPNLTKSEARELLETCMRVLWYRDCRAWNQIQIGTIDKDGIDITDSFELKTDWTVGGITYANPDIKNTGFLFPPNNMADNN